MGQKIFAIRIGDRYGIEYEHYLNSKLKNITWIRKPYRDDVLFQWNKLFLMNLNIDEPIVVIDIDIMLINEYMKLFDYPIKKDEFISIHSWWKDTDNPNYTMNGGFQKFYPKSCNYIYKKFMEDPLYWQQHYIKNGTTIGPVNGEQYFVEDSVKERLKLKLVPSEWVCRFKNNYNNDWLAQLNAKYPGDYAYIDQFNPDIKLVHYNQFNHLPLTPLINPK